MNSKDKAKELVMHFYPEVQWKLGQEDCLDRAKRCALVAVEFAKENPLNTEGYNKYLDEVKQEIELL